MPRRVEQVGPKGEYVDHLELAADADRQTFVGELVEHVEDPVLAYHRGCDPPRSHRTRHDCAAPAAAGCKIRWSARACRAWAAYEGPSTPRVARYARPACRLLSSPPGAAVRRSCDSHSGRIAGQAR